MTDKTKITRQTPRGKGVVQKLAATYPINQCLISIEPEYSTRLSQKPMNGTYSEPNGFSTHSKILISILIVPSSLHLGLPIVFFLVLRLKFSETLAVTVLCCHCSTVQSLYPVYRPVQRADV